MRHLPSANDKNRELAGRWRTSPECPSDDNDLRWSHKLMQNCTAEENACGSYFIKVTASIAKNTINASEFPILVTPTYYHSTIAALGCIKTGETPVEYETVTGNSTTPKTPQVNQTAISPSPNATHVGNYTTGHATNVTTSPLPYAPVSPAQNNTVYKQPENATSSPVNAKSSLVNATSSPVNVTYEGAVNTTLPQRSVLPTPQPFIDLIIPFLADNVMEIQEEVSPCVPLTHEENRTAYNTLVRINITGEYAMCKYCREDFCNSKVPTEQDLIATTTTVTTPPNDIDDSESTSTFKPVSGSATNGVCIFLLLAAVMVLPVLTLKQ